MPSNHLILCHPLLSPPIFSSIRVLSNESVLGSSWAKLLQFQLQHEYSGLISFRTEYLHYLPNIASSCPRLLEASAPQTALRVNICEVKQKWEPQLRYEASRCFDKRSLLFLFFFFLFKAENSLRSKNQIPYPILSCPEVTYLEL